MTDEEKESALALMAAYSSELASDSRADGWLTLAALWCSRAYFGKSYALALALYALHVGALADSDSLVSGSIASKTEGGLSVSFASVSTSSDVDPWLSLSRYGLMLWQLIRARRFPMVTGRT